MKVVTGFEAEVRGAILALDFVLSEDRRMLQRRQFSGFRDSAIFHRLWNLFGVIRHPIPRAKLSEEEEEALACFGAAFDALPWRELPSHPHVSQLDSDDLSALIPHAQRLSDLLKRRVPQPWWRRFFRRDEKMPIQSITDNSGAAPRRV